VSGKLTTHVLDTAAGRPAAGIPIRLLHRNGTILREAITNADGRCDTPLLQGAAFETGIYDLLFHVGAYYKGRGLAVPEPAFLDEIVLRFGVADATAHYHVPLLLSPFGYSTYRGS
jgi:5-hydroxyisourate hydrolase